jgi:hypothetical protein
MLVQPHEGALLHCSRACHVKTSHMRISTDFASFIVKWKTPIAIERT